MWRSPARAASGATSPALTAAQANGSLVRLVSVSATVARQPRVPGGSTSARTVPPG
ncbi:hypothetical protein ACFQY4_19100 [Catellatospora bangladeshensis]|uniref:hypothetical protein n=1 Tax=Catellatospora bangladeshensis TaxID=310355 RepID=UPI00360FE88B